jgi:hypothetical protein
MDIIIKGELKMSVFLRIVTDREDNSSDVDVNRALEDLKQLKNAIQESPHLRIANLNTRRAIPEIIVALGSAGAFTALYKIICELINKDKSKKFVVERTINGQKTKFECNGFSAKEMGKLFQMLPTELKEE